MTVVCRNYSGVSCASIGKKNSSENPSQSDDDEIDTILNSVSTTNNSSTCNRSLKNSLCIEKYLSCGNGSVRVKEKLETLLLNQTKTFCETCLKYSHIKNNALLPKGINIWLKNLSCIGKLFLEKHETNTSGE